VFTRLGGFDPRFFMYYEEVDLCRRIAASGLRVAYWPDLKAMHIGGASARTVDEARISRAGSQLESWRMRSALLYYRKHHGGLVTRAVHLFERGWYGLRALKAHGTGRAALAVDCSTHRQQLRDAWRDTRGGSLSPGRPW
jgi:GT2 family glycosyltransferase